jgi:uncharacterized membrane protein YhaH (DUF805 family)
MNFTDAVKAVFKKYVVFSGRSLRSEYWYWALFSFLASIVLSILDSAIFNTNSSTSTSLSGPLQSIFEVGTFLPSLAVGVRRLHDVNKSGWWWLIAFTIVGLIPLIIWAVRPGTPGKNNYGGPAPKKP